MGKHFTTVNDTFDYLAFKYYANEYLFWLIMQANMKYIDNDFLPPDIEIIIPEIQERNRKVIEPVW